MSKGTGDAKWSEINTKKQGDIGWLTSSGLTEHLEPLLLP